MLFKVKYLLNRYYVSSVLHKIFPFKAFFLLGPGMIAAIAGDDAGGIATYSVIGASYGYKMLWLLILIIPMLCTVQVMSARLGVVSSKGLTALIREEFSLPVAMIGIVSLYLSNAITAISEFFGIAAAFELFHVPRFVGVPIAAFVVWWLIVKGSYQKVEKFFLLLSSLFIAYFAASFLAGPDWEDVIVSSVVPTFYLESGFITLFIATIATSITPYMQIYAQSSVVEKGLTTRDLKFAEFDAILGSVVAMLVAIFIVITTGATLNKAGITVNTAFDAAAALTPIAGKYAGYLFGLGLFGASMLAAGVLPLTTAFSTCEAFGWRAGVSYSYKQAPVFYSIFTSLILLGALITLIPGIPLFKLLVFSYVLNGFFLPVEILFMFKLSNNKNLMGRYRNGLILNFFALLVLVIVVTAIILLFVTSLPEGVFEFIKEKYSLILLLLGV